MYVFNSLTQAAQVIMMLVMTFLASRIKRVKLVIGCSYLSLSVLATVFLLGACNPSLFGQSYVIAVFITAGFCYIGVGLYTILAYCLPYTIIDMKEYGKMTALGVLCAGASSFALSFVHTFVVARFSYMQAMAWFFILVIVCFALTTCVCLSLKEVEGWSGVIRETKDDVIAVFKNKDMYILLLPNFARGFAAGVMGVIAVVATSMEIVDKQTSSYVNIVMQVAMFVGNFLYVMLHKRLSSRTLLFISTIGVAVFFQLCISGGLGWFLIAFFVAYLFRMIIDTAIPVVVTEIIPQNQIGAYTSIRMLVFTGAQAIVTAVIPTLVNAIGYMGLLVFATLMQVVCGVVYWWVSRRPKRFFSDI